jgi:hypothetical protein
MVRMRMPLLPSVWPWRPRNLLPAALAVALLVGSSLGTAQAAQTVKLKVGFSPYRLNANAEFTYGVQIGSTTGALPARVTNVSVELPAGMGLGTSQLGLSVCTPEALRTFGVAGCPHEAVMGDGRAVLKAVSGSESLEVPAAVTVLMAPAQDEHTRLSFYAEGELGAITELTFPGVMEGVAKPFGTVVDTTIPPVESAPGMPAPVMTSMRITMAPSQLRYSKRVRGKTVNYHPKGMAVPAVCPAGGFPFAADLDFADGTRVVATTTLACPPTAPPARRGHHK